MLLIFKSALEVVVKALPCGEQWWPRVLSWRLATRLRALRRWDAPPFKQIRHFTDLVVIVLLAVIMQCWFSNLHGFIISKHHGDLLPLRSLSSKVTHLGLCRIALPSVCLIISLKLYIRSHLLALKMIRCIKLLLWLTPISKLSCFTRAIRHSSLIFLAKHHLHLVNVLVIRRIRNRVPGVDRRILAALE